MPTKEELTPELIKYLEAVDALAEAKSDFVFKNSSHTHAAIVLTTMLKHSKGVFRIYDNDLSGDIAEKYSEFYTELSDHVQKRGKALKIVIDNHNQEETPVFSHLTNLNKQYPNLVRLYRSTDLFKEAVTRIFNKPLNFAIGDENEFRVEELSPSSIPDSSRKAYCSFNNFEIADKLKTVFDNTLDKCEVIF